MGGEAKWNAELYDSKHSFVWERGADVVELLGPRAGERILDVGCGTGHLTARIAASGARVTALDQSAEMIGEARRNYPELEFVVADARDFHFGEPFDAVFSNAALHWIREPEAVARSIAGALKTGGRFVAELGGRGNVERLIDGLRRAREAMGLAVEADFCPWYFPSVGEYASLLEGQGLEVTFARLFDRLTPLEDGVAGLANWIRMFGGDFLAGLDVEQQKELIRQAAGLLRIELFRDGVWHADYRRLRVVAGKG
jgi:trans-aconitate methyltransferase